MAGVTCDRRRQGVCGGCHVHLEAPRRGKHGAEQTGARMFAQEPPKRAECDHLQL